MLIRRSRSRSHDREYESSRHRERGDYEPSRRSYSRDRDYERTRDRDRERDRDRWVLWLICLFFFVGCVSFSLRNDPCIHGSYLFRWVLMADMFSLMFGENSTNRFRLIVLYNQGAICSAVPNENGIKSLLMDFIRSEKL